MTETLIPFLQAFASDGWDTDPFKLVVDEKTRRLIGRGSSDDKGPLLGWLNVLEAHVKQGIELPVNLKFCFEGENTFRQSYCSM
jgi:Cys-Gly metallodipeptidase DUG1